MLVLVREQVMEEGLPGRLFLPDFTNTSRINLEIQNPAFRFCLVIYHVAHV